MAFEMNLQPTRLDEVLNSRRMSNSTLARLVKMNAGDIGQLRCGRHRGWPAQWEKIGEALGLPPEYLAETVPTPEPIPEL